VALWGWQPSRDGRLLAYITAASGSDQLEIRVRDVEKKPDYDEVLRWCRFTFIAWKDDNSGFFYNRYPEPGSVPPEDAQAYSRLYWHQVGTSQADDTLIYERPMQRN